VDELGALFNNLVLSEQAMSEPSRLRILTPPRQSRSTRITASPNPSRESKQQRIQALRTVIATRVGSNNQTWQVINVNPSSFQLSDRIVPVLEQATKPKSIGLVFYWLLESVHVRSESQNWEKLAKAEKPGRSSVLRCTVS
jgi:hypothetical protein